MLKTEKGAVNIKYRWTPYAAPLTVLKIKCTSVVYVNSTSHGFRNKVYISSLCYQPLSQFLHKTVKGAANINY
jgi:hypothetical protein